MENPELAQEMLCCLSCLSCLAAFVVLLSPWGIGIALWRWFTRKDRQQQHQEKDLALREKRAAVELVEAEAEAKKKKLQQKPASNKRLPRSINVNVANETLIAAVLPGIGRATAKKIISNRPATGYKDLPDLIAKTGLSPRAQKAIRGAKRKIKFK